MLDAVKPKGTEDMLRSVKRLVSFRSSERKTLVLTSDLRVDTTVRDGVGGPHDLSGNDPAIEARISRIEAAITAELIETGQSMEATPMPQPGGETTNQVEAKPAYPVDPEALRGLVGEIVREELRGALGEQITRNVRRYVRREVAQALAARELDEG